jgi:hypothetical protein
MPERYRVNLCAFDPMLVRGYVTTGARAVWWYLSNETYDEYKPHIGSKVTGKLLAVYDWGGEKLKEPNEHFEWTTTKESAYAVLLPPEVITKHELTAWKYLELIVEAIDDKDIYPGEEKTFKLWPIETMGKVHHYRLDYIPPIE